MRTAAFKTVVVVSHARPVCARTALPANAVASRARRACTHYDFLSDVAARRLQERTAGHHMTCGHDLVKIAVKAGQHGWCQSKRCVRLAQQNMSPVAASLLQLPSQQVPLHFAVLFSGPACMRHPGYENVYSQVRSVP